jgi:hypothetical protein
MTAERAAERLGDDRTLRSEVLTTDRSTVIERSPTMRLSLTTVARRFLLLSLVLGVFLVAAPRALAVPPVIGESGISGSVYRMTVCVDPDSPCFIPARALVTATALGTVAATSTAKTDAQGNFVLKLTPGLYRVSAAPKGQSSQQSEPALIRVYPGIMVAIRIVLPMH